MSLRTYILPLLLALSSAVLGQEPAYLHYEVSDGLPSSLVYCIEQDSMGVMWFGTDKGLVRFDGSRFKTFTIKDGLPDNEVLNMYHDSHGRLWLSCFRNKVCYERHGKIFTEAEDSILVGLPTSTGTFVFGEDSDGILWIAGGGVGICNIANNKVNFFDDTKLYPAKPLGVNIHSAFGLGDSVFAFSNNGVYNISNQGAAVRGLEWGAMDINSIGVHGNHVLCSMIEGLLLLEHNEQGFRITDKKLDGSYGRVYADKSGRFWIGSQTEGAIRFDHIENGLANPVNFLPDEKVTCVFEDKDGNFWFSTFNSGVFMLPKNASITYAHANDRLFESNNITSIAKLSNAELVVGDDAGRLYQFDRKKWYKKIKVGDSKGVNRVLRILPLPNDNWIAVTDRRVHSSQFGKLLCFNNHGAPKSVVYKDGKIWMGSSHALMYSDLATGDCQMLKEQRFTSLCLDHEGNIWAGGLKGLYSQRFDFEKGQDNVPKPLESRILDIKLGTDSSLWVATPNYGLLKLGIRNGLVERVEVINDSLGAPIENIQSIFLSPSGELWLATNTGVYALDKGYNVKHFDAKNGLIENNVNAVLVEGDTLWAATASGLTKMQLKEQGESGDFQTRFSAVRYNIGSVKHYFDLLSRPHIQLDELQLPSSATQLEVELAGLHYRNWGNMRFEYKTTEKLLPLPYLTFRNLLNCLFGSTDVSIVEGAVRNFGVNIAKGSYLTTVTAILPGGTRSSMPDQMTITVLPHWWQTIWFALAVVAILGYGLWRMLKAREDFLKIQNTNSELQLQAIRAQMNPHFVGNSINAIQQFFYPPDPVKASEYISIFSDLLRRTMYFSETDFITFGEELAYVEDYLKMIKLRFGDRFSYQIVGADNVPENTAFPSMLLQPILENATIHGLSPSGDSHVNIEFSLTAKRLACSITDNGVGIEASKARKLLRPGSRRISKGILLLEKKALTLNELYPADIKLEFLDLSHAQPGHHGTQVLISFLPQQKLANKYSG